LFHDREPVNIYLQPLGPPGPERSCVVPKMGSPDPWLLGAPSISDAMSVLPNICCKEKSVSSFPSIKAPKCPTTLRFGTRLHQLYFALIYTKGTSSFRMTTQLSLQVSLIGNHAVLIQPSGTQTRSQILQHPLVTHHSRVNLNPIVSDARKHLTFGPSSSSRN
jgi:hypothetical protein